MQTRAEKSRENRLRKKADRYGLRLIKSPRRDPHAVDYGLYGLTDLSTNVIVNPSLVGRYPCSWTLDQVEAFVTNIEAAAAAGKGR